MTKKYNPTEEFRVKCEDALAQIKSLDEFRASDTMVEYVMKTANWLFTTRLDQHSPDVLISTGGKLTGVYAYLGQKSARARAERDVYEQKADEMQKEYIRDRLREEPKYKVTTVKSEVAVEFSALNELVNVKEAEKMQWENLTNACQTMIMFTQSALRVKEGERYSTSRSHNN